MKISYIKSMLGSGPSVFLFPETDGDQVELEHLIGQMPEGGPGGAYGVGRHSETGDLLHVDVFLPKAEKCLVDKLLSPTMLIYWCWSTINVAMWVSLAARDGYDGWLLLFAAFMCAAGAQAPILCGCLISWRKAA